MFNKFRLTTDNKKKFVAANFKRKIKGLTDSENQTLSPKRKRTGCFCCRKRRIKCIGTRPVCENCLKKSYLCVWPDGEESLSHNTEFKLTKVIIDKETLNLNKPNQATTDTCNFRQLEGHSDVSSSIDLNSKVIQKTYYDSTDVFDSVKDAMFRKVLIELNSSVLESQISRLTTFPVLTNKEVFLFNAFTNGFMTDVSPQFTHAKLQPGAVFIPPGINNAIMQRIFFACGASFLLTETKSLEMKKLSNEQFRLYSDGLTDFIQSCDISGNEEWIILSLLLSYLKLRYVRDSQTTNTLSMISIVEGMKFWILKKRQQSTYELSITSSEDGPEFELHTFSSKLGDNPKVTNPIIPKQSTENEVKFCQIINAFRKKLKGRDPMVARDPDYFIKPSDIVSVDSEIYFAISGEETQKRELLMPYEKTMLDSFIFNYSTMLFTCDKSLVGEIASPFIVYDLIRPYLLHPIYKCVVPWMNHPVVGAALPMFELQAKICWLGLRLPLSTEDSTIVHHIRKTASFYIRPILPARVYTREPVSVQQKLLESCFAAEIMSKAIYIYATKLLYPRMQCDDESIQTAAEQAYQAFQKLSFQSQVHVVLCFAMTVLGSVALSKKHRQFWLLKMDKLKAVSRVRAFESMRVIFQKAWYELDETCRPMGWDVLLDNECLKILLV